MVQTIKKFFLDPVRNFSIFWHSIKTVIISNGVDLLFPKSCFGCQREGSYFCQDCQATLEISSIHQKMQSTPLEISQKYNHTIPKTTKFLTGSNELSDLYFATDYQKPLIKNLIHHFKYEPLVKELAKPLTSLIIEHFQLLDQKPDLADFVLIPVPLERRRLKWRGFNQAEEIGKELSKFLNIEILNNVLIKTKETQPQVELSDEERKENIKGAFLVVDERSFISTHRSARVKDDNLIKSEKILLVDDVYTTGATMAECARVLKTAGAKEIIGVVVARG